MDTNAIGLIVGLLQLLLLAVSLVVQLKADSEAMVHIRELVRSTKEIRVTQLEVPAI